MAYLGKDVIGILSHNKVMDTMTGDGSDTTLTLSRTPGAAGNVEVYLDGIYQTPDVEYTLSGNTITFTTAPATSTKVVAIVGNDSTVATPARNSISGTKIAPGAVTDAKIASGITASKLTGALPALNGSALTNMPSGFTKNASDPTVSTNPSGGVGTVWINTTSGEGFVCTDATAGENVWTNIGAGSGDVEPWTFPGTVFGYTMGGYTSTTVNVIDKFSFTSQADATDVGDLETTTRANGTHSSSTHGWSSGRGVWDGGSTKIEKVAFASDGNAVDSNIDLSSARGWHAGASSTTHGYTIGGGHANESPLHNIIDKFSFSATGTASDIGDLDQQAQRVAGHSSETHGYGSGGANGAPMAPYRSNIQKISFSTDGNSTTVSNLSTARAPDSSGGSSLTHGYTLGGYNGSSLNIMEKFAFANENTVTDVGDLWRVVRHHGVTSAEDAMYVCGGWLSGAGNHIQKRLTASDGDSIDWADLSVARYSSANPSY